MSVEVETLGEMELDLEWVAAVVEQATARAPRRLLPSGGQVSADFYARIMTAPETAVRERKGYTIDGDDWRFRYNYEEWNELTEARQVEQLQFLTDRLVNACRDTPSSSLVRLEFVKKNASTAYFFSSWLKGWNELLGLEKTDQEDEKKEKQRRPKDGDTIRGEGAFSMAQSISNMGRDALRYNKSMSDNLAKQFMQAGVVIGWGNATEEEITRLKVRAETAEAQVDRQFGYHAFNEAVKDVMAPIGLVAAHPDLLKILETLANTAGQFFAWDANRTAEAKAKREADQGKNPQPNGNHQGNGNTADSDKPKREPTEAELKSALKQAIILHTKKGAMIDAAWLRALADELEKGTAS